MDPVRVFLSFDRERDRDLRDRLIEESRRPYSRFEVVARMPQTGVKFGRWLDLVLMQRLLDHRERPDA